MAPRLYSRFTFCTGQDDADGKTFLSEREPFRYTTLPDNTVHIVCQGDTLWHLAHRYFQPIKRAAGLWWVIADFQPDPIFDPTVELAEGTALIIPSVRTVLEKVFSEARRTEETV